MKVKDVSIERREDSCVSLVFILHTLLNVHLVYYVVMVPAPYVILLICFYLAVKVTLTKKAETPLAKKRSAPGTEENGDQARIGSKRKRDLGEAEDKAKKKKTDTGGAVVEENPLPLVKVVGAKDKSACHKGSLGKTQSRAPEVPGASKVAEKSHLAAESSSSGSSSSSESEAEIPSAMTGKGLSSNVDHQAQSKTAPKINANTSSKTTCSKVPVPTADSSSSCSSSDSSDSTESTKTKQPVVEKAALSNAVRVRPTAGSSSDSSSSEEDSSSDDNAKVVTKNPPLQAGYVAAKAPPSTSASVKKKPVIDSSDDSSSSNSDDSSSDDDTAAASKISEKAAPAASRPSVPVIPTKESVVVRPEQTVSGKPKRKRKRKNRNKNKLPPVQSQPIAAPPALRTAAEFLPAGAGKRKVFNDEEEEEESSSEEESSEEESSEEQAEGGGSDFTAEEIRSLYSLSKPAAAVTPVSSIGPQLPKVCLISYSVGDP